MKKIIITKIAVGSIASAAGCTGLAGCGDKPKPQTEQKGKDNITSFI